MDGIRSGVAEEKAQQGRDCYEVAVLCIRNPVHYSNINRAGGMSERNRMLGIGLMGIIIGIGIALFFIVILNLTK
jgi:hypothetical protein